MTTSLRVKKRVPRAVSKERHKVQLIEAAKLAIHKYGVRGATISNIQALSGLSRGMINTRFKSKENLLVAVAKEMANDYDSHWKNALCKAGPDPVNQLKTLILSDFSEKVLNEPNLSIWFAFRSEAKSRPEYLAYIDTRGKKLTETLQKICEQLAIVEGKPASDGIIASHLIIAVLEGLWVDYHLHPKKFDRKKAQGLCLHLISHLFPTQFRD